MLDPTSPRPRSLSGSGSLSGSEIALMAVMVLIAGLVRSVWLTGELAALLASGHTVVVDPGELAHVLVRLPSHLANPARAWPPRTHAALPGPPSSTCPPRSSSPRWPAGQSARCVFAQHSGSVALTGGGRGGRVPATCAPYGCGARGPVG